MHSHTRCIYIYIYIYTHTHTCICDIHIHTHIYYTFIYIHTYTIPSTLTYIHTYTIHTHIYYTYIHTYTIPSTLCRPKHTYPHTASSHCARRFAHARHLHHNACPSRPCPSVSTRTHCPPARYPKSSTQNADITVNIHKYVLCAELPAIPEKNPRFLTQNALILR
jgi:hypothetical protein